MNRRQQPIERKPATVYRGRAACVQNVYIRRDAAGNVVDRWVWVMDRQYPVRPAPGGRGYVVSHHDRRF